MSYYSTDNYHRIETYSTSSYKNDNHDMDNYHRIDT